jgi:hypothetical protein
MAKLAGRNVRLSEYAAALKEFSAKEKIPYSDQFHALVDVWGENKPREALAGNLAIVRIMAANRSLDGVEHLRAFLEVHDRNPSKPVSMQGDAVHPGPPGQLMMAAALLKGLGAEPFVSSVSIDAAASKPAEASKAKGCEVRDVKVALSGAVSFERLDECLPFPIPDSARAVLPLAPGVLDLSQYTLAVTTLPAGNYLLKINGEPCAAVTEKQLAAGINLTDLRAVSAETANPIQAQAQAVLKAVEAKEGLVNQWRGLSPRATPASAGADLKAQLAELAKKVEEADGRIREAAKPQKLRFEIVPQK